jgi:hypothetical protein
MRNAYTMFDGSGGTTICGSNTWNSNTGCNGDGNGLIGASVADMRENGRLLVHLSLAKILSEAITYKSTSGYAVLKTTAQDANAPLSTISDGAVFDFYSSRFEGLLYAQSGLWLGITSVSGCCGNPAFSYARFGSANTMTPEMAFAIDTKLDDGLPTTGNAVTISSSASTGQCATSAITWGLAASTGTPIAPSTSILYNTNGANSSRYSCNILLKTVYE